MSDSTKLLRELVELVQVCPPLLADIEVSYFAVLHGRLLLCHQAVQHFYYLLQQPQKHKP